MYNVFIIPSMIVSLSLVDLMVNATLKYLEEAASSSTQPFYLFHSFTTPHAGGIGSVSVTIDIHLTDLSIEQDGETGVPAPYDLPQYKSEWPRVGIVFC